MSEKVTPADKETLQNVIVAAGNFLEKDGFILDERTATVPEYLQDEYDLKSVRVQRAEEFEALLCHVMRPDTADTVFRIESYYIYDNGTVKGYIASADLTEGEKEVYASLEGAYNTWEHELLRLVGEGVLDETEEREALERTLNNVAYSTQRYIDAQQLLAKASTEEEKTAINQLIENIKSEVEDKQGFAEAIQGFVEEPSESLAQYVQASRRLYESYGDELAAKAEAVKRAMDSVYRQSMGLEHKSGSNLTEAEAWGLLRVIDKVADF